MSYIIHDFITNFVVPIVVFIVAIILIMATITILRQYERAVIFTFGRFQYVKGPGLVFIIPFLISTMILLHGASARVGVRC